MRPTYEKQPSLADRISRNKLYLLADSTVGKRKRGQDEGEVEVAAETAYRPNALLVTGTPISHLDNDRIFAYGTHYSVRPLGIEWVNDSNVVLVFHSSADAEDALGRLQRDPKQEADADGFVTARGIPMSILGKSSELRGALHLRWARVDDVKKRNARRESEFYRKHSRTPAVLDGERQPKRQRQDDGPPKLTREDLDQELDTFLQQEEDAPVSKMYADRVEAEGNRFGPDSRHHEPERDRRPRGGRARRGGERPACRPEPQRTEPRPHKTQQELDDELDAFLSERT